MILPFSFTLYNKEIDSTKGRIKTTKIYAGSENKHKLKIEMLKLSTYQCQLRYKFAVSGTV